MIDFRFFKHLLVCVYVKIGTCGNSRIKVQELGANFTSPGWPGDYRANLRCYWVVLAPEQYRVLVIFLEFDTQVGFDYLVVGNNLNFAGGLTISG